MYKKMLMILGLMTLILTIFLQAFAEQTVRNVFSEAFRSAAITAYEEGTFVGQAHYVDVLSWPENVPGYDKDRYLRVNTPFFGCILALPEGSPDAEVYFEKAVRLAFDMNALHLFDSLESITSDNVLRPQTIEIIGGYFDGVITEKDGNNITMSALYDSDEFQKDDILSFVINHQTLVMRYEDDIEETKRTGVPTVIFYRSVGEEFELSVGDGCLVIYDDNMKVLTITKIPG